MKIKTGMRVRFLRQPFQADLCNFNTVGKIGVVAEYLHTGLFSDRKNRSVALVEVKGYAFATYVASLAPEGKQKGQEGKSEQEKSAGKSNTPNP